MTDDPPDLRGLRIRQAVRALVVDGHQRILLVRFEFPEITVWATPGGGMEPGETELDTLARELDEELGLTDVEVGPHIWNRTHVIPFFDGQFDGQQDRYHLVRVAAGFEPRPRLSWEQLNAERIFELRWWTLDELHGPLPDHTRFAPQRLAGLVADLLTTGPPPVPLDTGV